ncbi:hypothetical protein AV540_25740 [Brevibacillus parabrevis]|uniref:hypothetical protein n=1 Tax=Brevibacillus parabrevis TaxID=54914 RepID=UPI0007AB36A4|nr:hypothetical protein [Brevibacillus parabrevis]KZE40470.1 hypothetical protein AV540_25740 [Brevibacillus parabrevis]
MCLNKTKILICLLLLFVVFVLSSCGSTKKGMQNSNAYNIDNSQINEIKQNSYQDKGIVIRYPQLLNSKNGIKQDEINKLIKDEAMKVLNYYADGLDVLALEIHYKIKYHGEKLMSIEYTGIGNIKGSAHPNNIFFTTNINLEEARKIRLADIVTINEQFFEVIKSGKFTLQNGVIKDKSEVVQRFNEYSIDELAKMFTNSDSLDKVGTEQQSDVFSYFTNDNLGISFGVPHVLGDHLEIEIKYSDILKNLKINIHDLPL